MNSKENFEEKRKRLRSDDEVYNMKNKRFAVLAMLLIILAIIAVRFAIAVPIGQSMKIFNSDGSEATSGNITILISETEDCAGGIANQTFENQLDRGIFSRTVELNLTYGKTYYECVQYNRVNVSGPFKIYGLGAVGSEDLSNNSFTFNNNTIISKNLTTGNLTVTKDSTLIGKLDAVGNVYTPHVYASTIVSSRDYNITTSSGGEPKAWIISGNADGVTGSEEQSILCIGNSTLVSGRYDYSAAWPRFCLRRAGGYISLDGTSVFNTPDAGQVIIGGDGDISGVVTANAMQFAISQNGLGLQIPTGGDDVSNIAIATVNGLPTYGLYFDLSSYPSDAWFKWKMSGVDIWRISALTQQVSQDGGLAVNTDAFFVNATNKRVGVGTANPLCKLTVAGAAPETPAIADNDNTIAIYGDGLAYFKGRDVTNDIEFIIGTSATGAPFYGSMTNHDVQCRTGNTNRMIIDHDASNIVIRDTWKLQWGSSGVDSPDTDLYRSAADMLKTDDNLTVKGVHLITEPQNHTISDNATCVIIKGTTSQLAVC